MPSGTAERVRVHANEAGRVRRRVWRASVGDAGEPDLDGGELGTSRGFSEGRRRELLREHAVQSVRVRHTGGGAGEEGGRGRGGVRRLRGESRCVSGALLHRRRGAGHDGGGRGQVLRAAQEVFQGFSKEGGEEGW